MTLIASSHWLLAVNRRNYGNESDVFDINVLRFSCGCDLANQNRNLFLIEGPFVYKKFSSHFRGRILEFNLRQACVKFEELGCMGNLLKRAGVLYERRDIVRIPSSVCLPRQRWCTARRGQIMKPKYVKCLHLSTLVI